MMHIKNYEHSCLKLNLVPVLWGKNPAVSGNSTVFAVWSSHTDPFAKGMQCKEQAS
jgi:hypothetical protein